MPLAANDLVLICINAMPNLLGRMPVDSLLTNGKIEKQLKFFLAAAWEHANPAARAYVMDKRPFNGFELDLLAFEDGRPKFWIEAKSSFKDDWNDVQKAEKKAVRQAADRVMSTALQERDCDGYIVHFLTSLPRPGTSLLPPFMMQVFNELREPQPSELASRARELEVIYQLDAGELYDSSEATRIWPAPLGLEPTVCAVVVKLSRRR